MKKSAKVLTAVSFIILALFSLFGLFIMMNVFHELQHKKDLSGLVKSESICLLEFPTGDLKIKGILYSTIASYRYNIVEGSEIEASEMMRKSEKKASTINFAMSLIFLTSLAITFNKTWDWWLE